MSAPRKKTTKKTEVQPKVKARPNTIPGARVRFDADAKQWSYLNAGDNPENHFEYGYMKNVTFSRLLVRGGMVGCGGREYVGIATGDLVIGKYHRDQKNLINLGFNGQAFIDLSTGAPLNSTPLLHILPNRKALAKIPTA